MAAHKMVLVLSGGAPHAPLMAGALYGLYPHKRHSDYIYTSGAGALVGLLLIAPKGDRNEDKPPESLRKVLTMGIADEIYKWVPLGYKTFFKPGPFTRPFHRLAQRFKLREQDALAQGDTLTEAWWRLLGIAPEDRDAEAEKKFKQIYNDGVDLWFSFLTPTDLNYWSKGLCAPLPFLEDLVDFGAVKKNFKGDDFCVNAYKLRDQARGIEQGIEEFSTSQGEITPEHLRAALAFPFIYPPARADYVDQSNTRRRASFVEGAGHEPVFTPLRKCIDKLTDCGVEDSTIVLIDILASFEAPFAREPRDLWDAYGLSIIGPVVELAKRNLEQLRERVRRDHKKYTLLAMDFKGLIPEDRLPYILDWNQKNLDDLWEVGKKAGEKFWQDHKGELPPDP